jgi:hypothetical protein
MPTNMKKGIKILKGLVHELPFKRVCNSTAFGVSWQRTFKFNIKLKGRLSIRLIAGDLII